MRIFKILLFLVVAAVAGLGGYAYFGDLRPQTDQIRQPVQLDVQ